MTQLAVWSWKKFIFPSIIVEMTFFVIINQKKNIRKIIYMIFINIFLTKNFDLSLFHT